MSSKARPHAHRGRRQDLAKRVSSAPRIHVHHHQQRGWMGSPVKPESPAPLAGRRHRRRRRVPTAANHCLGLLKPRRGRAGLRVRSACPFCVSVTPWSIGGALWAVTASAAQQSLEFRIWPPRIPSDFASGTIIDRTTFVSPQQRHLVPVWPWLFGVWLLAAETTN